MHITDSEDNVFNHLLGEAALALIAGKIPLSLANILYQLRLMAQAEENAARQAACNQAYTLASQYLHRADAPLNPFGTLLCRHQQTW